MEVTPSGTTACPLALGVYLQPAVTPPSTSRTKIVVSIVLSTLRGERDEEPMGV